MEAREYCTCGDKACPLNPANHDKGCDLCIQKNLKLGEIPSCFFNAVGNASDFDSFKYEDFARLVLNKK